MGSDPISLPLLDFIWKQKDIELTAIYTQPDRPSGRGKKVKPNAIKYWAAEKALPIFQPEKPGMQDTKWILENNIDISLVMAYGHLLPQDLLDAAQIETLNIHASLLPKYRGASPIETAIASGEKITGVSLMKITKKMDSGPIIDQEEVEIIDHDTGSSLRQKLADACVPLLERNLQILNTPPITFTEQDESNVSYCRKLRKEDASLDFELEAKELASRIRAFSHWPKCQFIYEGIPIKCGMAQCSESGLTEEAGTIIKTSDGSLDIATSNGILQITQLQKPGGKMMSAQDFLRGFSFEVGDKISSFKTLPLVSKQYFK